MVGVYTTRKGFSDRDLEIFNANPHSETKSLWVSHLVAPGKRIFVMPSDLAPTGHFAVLCAGRTSAVYFGTVSKYTENTYHCGRASARIPRLVVVSM